MSQNQSIRPFLRSANRFGVWAVSLASLRRVCKPTLSDETPGFYCISASLAALQ